jgi:UDP-N-acetylglucosamine transferase subunit ALG13
MILVCVGSSQFPFDRLLRAVDTLPRREQLVVQHGPSDIRPSNARCVPYVPFERFTELVRVARVVVTHGGVGSILVSLTNGKRPYVVPRLEAFGETVDDHQVESARRFAEAGLVTLVEDPATLGEALFSNGHVGAALPATSARSPLVAELRDYLATRLGPPNRGPSA